MCYVAFVTIYNCRWLIIAAPLPTDGAFGYLRSRPFKSRDPTELGLPQFSISELRYFLRKSRFPAPFASGASRFRTRCYSNDMKNNCKAMFNHHSEHRAHPKTPIRIKTNSLPTLVRPVSQDEASLNHATSFHCFARDSYYPSHCPTTESALLRS